jgi:hypothetical protein
MKERLSSRIKTTTNLVKDEDKKERLYSVGGNVK